MDTSSPVRIMFQDEARFGRINMPCRCWVPQGLRPTVCAQLVREYTWAYAAVTPSTGDIDALIIPCVNTEAMQVFLREVASRHPQEQMLMFMDNAAWHTTPNLQIPENMRLAPLPPYSPELNPAEHVWDEMREKWFGNVVFSSMQDVEDRMVEALRDLMFNPQRVQTLTGFKWIISI